MRGLLSRRLKVASVLIVLLGVFSAEGLYWYQTRSTNESTNPELLGNEKAAARQREAMFGNSTAALQERLDDFKSHPGQQAAVVFGLSVVLAAGCLFLAHQIDDVARNSS
jgi:hypothetical protein